MQNKYKVFFRRVSTSGQDLAMQESADAIYREKYATNEIVILNENGVSANKLNIEQRPKMKKLIRMIMQNQVDTIYAFDRSRLFRDFYESNYFVSLCKKHDVNIFFTSAGNGQQQATGSTLLEGVMNIVGDVEGKNIARRNEEARRRYPPRKVGYIKNKETRKYLIDSDKKDSLLQFFSSLIHIETLDHLEETLHKFRKLLKLNREQLLKISNDAFYAGYDLSTGENKLLHVEPYISFQQFKLLQEKNTIISRYKETQSYLKNQDVFEPVCGMCRKRMNFYFDVIGEKAWYSCSRKHLKVQISTDDLLGVLKPSLEKLIDHFDVDSLAKDSKYYFQQFKEPIEAELKIVEKNKRDLLENIILESDSISGWREDRQYKKLAVFEKEQRQLLTKLEMKRELLLENENLSKYVKEYLRKCSTSNPLYISRVLIQCIYIYQNEVKLELNKFDYLKKLNTNYFYQGDKLI